MNAAEIYQWWAIWLAVAGLIVVAAAVLLLAILYLARSIAKLSFTAIGVVAEIEENTRVIWQLAATNQVADDLLDGARAIHGNAGAIVDALAEADRNRAA